MSRDSGFERNSGLGEVIGAFLATSAAGVAAIDRVVGLNFAPQSSSQPNFNTLSGATPQVAKATVAPQETFPQHGLSDPATNTHGDTFVSAGVSAEQADRLKMLAAATEAIRNAHESLV